LSRDQIEIHAEQYRIVIRGARAAGPSSDVACEQFHRVERGHGRFSRAFTLPEAIDVERVSADLKDGILTVSIPKAVEQARRIDVT
jgi:HSP20 family protein